MNVRWVGAEKTVYELVGGSNWFYELMDFFYEDVEMQNQIRHLYPEDLSESKRNTADFLIQYWGGPSEYSDKRGHPRLRMRHAPFPIGETERDAWLASMDYALAKMEPETRILEAMKEYFKTAANHMVNNEKRQ
ncbi:MAG TPA: globin [Acidimicrobiales bacterium]|nr:globin [Acidimicrobiales bacterium]HJM28468.1 globin [Acidimicrobiales bacterium]HJM98222.1 globin [Acidimicrobiales bacterium]